jgi:hypothetical protein
VSKKELHDTFGKGWAIESIEPVRVEVRSDIKDLQFSEDGPKVWFAVVRRATLPPLKGGNRREIIRAPDFGKAHQSEFS